MPTTHPVADGDAFQITAVLAGAFAADPVMGWFFPETEFPDEQARIECLAAFFGTLLEFQYGPYGACEVARPDEGLSGGGSGPVAAAALWTPPGSPELSEQTEQAMGLRMVELIGDRLDRLVSAYRRLREHVPDTPHWYLGVLGADPALRGGGYGAALLRSRLATCDADGVPAYLEASKEANIGYYERFGFAIRGGAAGVELPDGGPVVWPMWREPR
ncbi:GNAT family N-acetyltransferase [Streptomyces sp. NPDC050617]|uniref:GNAT family N-acetyltransferase n=1 Tax=Streptomyces sp. NPDC050617 TaxID=3154628 RepID=UPI0034487FEC